MALNARALCNCHRPETVQGSRDILTTPEEVEIWMTAPGEEALKLQRPLRDGALRIVARGVKEGAAPSR
jgi:hypothetical protein